MLNLFHLGDILRRLFKHPVNGLRIAHLKLLYNIECLCETCLLYVLEEHFIFVSPVELLHVHSCRAHALFHHLLQPFFVFYEKSSVAFLPERGR